MRTSLTLAILLLTLAACGGDDAAHAPTDAGPTPDAAPVAEQHGQVLVLEGTRQYMDGNGNWVPTPYAWIGGRFLDAAEPLWHTETMASGSCRLLRYQLELCDPPCIGVCFQHNVCKPWPQYRSAGTLTLLGLTVPAMISPDPSGTYNHPTAPVTELFTDDAVIQVSASGAASPAFSGTVRGVPQLVPAIQHGAITLAKHQDHTLSWTPAPGSDTRVRLTINSVNGTHGAPWDAIIECDVPDSAGQITIPAAMVDAFPESEVSWGCVAHECPPSSIQRYRETIVARDGGGNVSLIAGSVFEFGVEHHLAP